MEKLTCSSEEESSRNSILLCLHQLEGSNFPLRTTTEMKLTGKVPSDEKHIDDPGIVSDVLNS